MSEASGLVVLDIFSGAPFGSLDDYEDGVTTSYLQLSCVREMELASERVGD